MTSGTQSQYIRPEDVEFYERELASFIPDRVFDAHCHVWHSDFVKVADCFPPDVSYEQYARYMQDIHPGRTTSGLFIPLSRDGKTHQIANEWASRQTGTAQAKRSGRGLLR